MAAISSLLAAIDTVAMEPIPARLDLVAVDQTTNPLIFEGSFDVYHLVVRNQVGIGLELTLVGLNLIESTDFAGDVVEQGTALPTIGGAVIPYSFFVSEAEPLQQLGLGLERTDSSLSGYVGSLGVPLFPGIGDGDAQNEITIAVLTVPAGSPKPVLEGTLGATYSADIIGIVPSTGPLPGDVNNDRTVDLLDLDISAPIYPFSNPGLPILDFNGDGAADGKDMAIFSANYGQRVFPDPELIQFFAVDATEAAIFADPSFLPSGPFDLLDLDILGANFGKTPATVSDMDLNSDRVVDLLDLDILGRGFRTVATAIPEPNTVALLTLALSSFLRLKRHSR